MRKLLLSLAALVAGSGAAAAQGMLCGPWANLKAALEDHLGELPIGGGTISETVIMRVLSSAEGGTFSIVLVDRQGNACRIAAGRNWAPGENPTSSPVEKES